MQFIVGHGDVFHSILRDRQPELNLHALQELALTTAVVARANCFGNCSKFLKILNTFFFLFSHKMLIFRAGIHKMLVRIANREDPD